jgi:cytosine/adenosine deaminase-related metal-dependent hydrolase
MIREMLLPILLALAVTVPASAENDGMMRVADRGPTEGAGPYPTLVIRGATMIDGSGAPPRGPVDIIVHGNRIAEIRAAGTPGLAMKPDREPRRFDREIDATGMYILPGFVDTHGHNGSPEKGPDASYGYKLWLAHGVTTVRGVPFYFGTPNRSMDDKKRSAANQIVAPRLYVYLVLGDGWSGGNVDTPDKARAWVKWAAANGVDGIKFFNNDPPEVMKAAIEAAKAAGLGTVAHLSQTGVAQVNARTAGEWGLGTVTHFYGHFESLLKDGRVQKFPSDYNYNNEQQRFGGAADIWDQTVEPGSPEWTAYLEEQKANHVTFDPTFTIYSASRDLMRARNADWQARYALPSLWDFFQSSRENHGSYFYDWTTQNEVTWRRFYTRWMQLMNDYKNIGGRVTTGSDPGFIYELWGFGYIQEFELLQEAGFSPLEVIQAATINGATTLAEPKGQPPEFGLIRVGMLADLVIAPENPLANFKTLYGTGHLRLNPVTDKQERVGGVKWTIKDGIVYDAHKLLDEVAKMVADAKAKRAAP